MSRRLLALVAVAAVSVVAAVGIALARSAPARQAATVPTYVRDVAPILDGRCVSCHVAGGLGPFPLGSYAAARRHRLELAAAVAARQMPPWHADSSVRAYRNDPSLTRAQIATVVRWARNGAPRGSGPKAAALPRVGGALSRVDLRLELPRYTPTRRGGHDDYHCFVVRWPGTSTGYVTGMDVAPGTRRQVHHVIVYAAGPQQAATYDAWDAAERAPGYGCYGGPSATGQRTVTTQLLGGWAPGSNGGDFAAGTGIEVEPGSRLIVQIHYHLLAPARLDRSLVRLRIDPAVEHRAAFLPVVDPTWLLTPRTFRIPAGVRRIPHRATLDPGALAAFLGVRADFRDGYVVQSVLLHMHQLGRRGTVALLHQGGPRELLLRIPHWDFNWQRDYTLAAPARFRPGDALEVTCEHDNTRANQPVVNGKQRKPRTVYWGEDTTDEMCVAFVYASEP